MTTNLSRGGTAKSNKELKENKTLYEELEHQIAKSNLLENDRNIFWRNAEETKRKNNELIE
jgi:hypothetical protein